MKLVITEKPSVAFSIAKIIGAQNKHDGYLEGGGYLVSWCYGHLLELAEPELYDESLKRWSYEALPIVPEKWKHRVLKDKNNQLSTLVKLMNEKTVDCIVCATDAGREGELIFRRVYQYAKCGKPIERLWISSMEDEAVKEGFNNLRSGQDYDLLYKAAVCRAEADWLVGMNATRLFTVLYGSTLKVGRVMSPTLALLVKRESEINGFICKPFYVPEIDCGSFKASAERTDSKEKAESVRSACDGQYAVVKSVDTQTKTVQPPKLYDLTTLQRECNRIFGFTAQQTLDYIQSLYEKKLCTYPRTDSRYLTEDIRDTAKKLIVWLRDNMSVGSEFKGEPDIARITDNAKVTDHHAIIPTMEIEKINISELPKGERCILSLVSQRLLCAVSQPHFFEVTTATLNCAGNIFTAKGKTVRQSGWKEIEQKYLSHMKKNAEAEEKELPILSEGQSFDKVTASVREGKTTPPKRYTEDSLLSAMESAGADETPYDAERKGLGTPATRAAIIEKLVAGGFAERKNKLLIPTTNGINLITVLPDNIKSPLLTAEWESKLMKIERGELDADSFMNGIIDMVRDMVQTHNAPERKYISMFPNKNSEREIIGVCPRCGSAVIESQRGFFCNNKECSFGIWKDNRFFRDKRKTVTKHIAAVLLKEGRVYVKDLYSEKKNKTYGAYVVLDDTGGKYVNFKLDFPQKKGGRK